jgi:hypothetical protein
MELPTSSHIREAGGISSFRQPYQLGERLRKNQFYVA